MSKYRLQNTEGLISVVNQIRIPALKITIHFVHPQCLYPFLASLSFAVKKMKANTKYFGYTRLSYPAPDWFSVYAR